MNKVERKIFLKARWENLVMINYEVDPEILVPYLPKFTELDVYNGKVLISLVGFMFTHTKVFGLQWPWHTHFEEVNLRFYVKHFNGTTWKRGVVFISEIVPSPIIATLARWLYHEPYKATAMKHTTAIAGEEIKVDYSWKYNNKWNNLQVTADTGLNRIEEGSEEEFIFEHYWGYNRYNVQTTIEYGVEHDVWQVYKVKDWRVDCAFGVLYGEPVQGAVFRNTFISAVGKRFAGNHKKTCVFKVVDVANPYQPLAGRQDVYRFFRGQVNHEKFFYITFIV